MTGEPPDGHQPRGGGFSGFFWIVMAIVVAIAGGIALFVTLLNG